MGTACVWAEDLKTRLWEEKPTSFEGGRQNFAFHSGKWGRTLAIIVSPSDPSLLYISLWKPEIAARQHFSGSDPE